MACLLKLYYNGALENTKDVVTQHHYMSQK